MKPAEQRVFFYNVFSPSPTHTSQPLYVVTAIISADTHALCAHARVYVHPRVRVCGKKHTERASVFVVRPLSVAFNKTKIKHVYSLRYTAQSNVKGMKNDCSPPPICEEQYCSVHCVYGDGGATEQEQQQVQGVPIGLDEKKEASPVIKDERYTYTYVYFMKSTQGCVSKRIRIICMYTSVLCISYILHERGDVEKSKLVKYSLKRTRATQSNILYSLLYSIRTCADGRHV